jgi:leucyl/phenylalanyl-tRNA--protein transferase
MPVEPPPSPWAMPDPRSAAGDLVAVGADLEPGTLLAAYRGGLFPMPVEGQLAWWSPQPRTIIPLDGVKVSRSLRKSCARFEIRIDTVFDEVIAACADPSRPRGWITGAIRTAYLKLHRLGWAHSVEAWDSAGRLAGGLYGVAIGGLFAGESMFHHATDASKVTLVALVELLGEGGAGLLDVQWMTDHLASLGAIEISREEYLRRLVDALDAPLPDHFDRQR